MPCGGAVPTFKLLGWVCDPALQCKLFNSLVLPILGYACEDWDVDYKTSSAAEILYRQLLKQLLHISHPNEIVFAGSGRYQLPIHFWQQVWRCHNMVLKLSNESLVKTALTE